MADIPEAVVVVNEAFEGATVERWARLIAGALAMRPRRLVVDLRRSSRVDAAAIAVLLQVHRAMMRDGGRLVLRGPAERVMRILRLSRLDQVFAIDGVRATRVEPAGVTGDRERVGGPPHGSSRPA